MQRLGLVVAVCFAFCVLAVQSHEFDLNKEPRQLFNEWTKYYGRFYASAEEREKRFSYFTENIQRIKSLNEEYQGRATFELNQFADMSHYEFMMSRTGARSRAKWEAILGKYLQGVLPRATPEQLRDIPEEVDWRKHDPPVVTPVKNQGRCGSCWAFSATGNIEGQWALAGNPLVGLSEQQLVDCDHTCVAGACDSGCDGGLMENAFAYVIKNGGIQGEDTYPYEGVDNRCRFNSSAVAATIRAYKAIPHDPEQMAYYVATQGPISVAVDAETWQFYSKGIVKSNCGTRLDHGVLVVGYGVEDKTPYWIVKNSWGTRWGMEGYILVQRGPENTCGINKYPITAIV